MPSLRSHFLLLLGSFCCLTGFCWVGEKKWFKYIFWIFVTVFWHTGCFPLCLRSFNGILPPCHRNAPEAQFCPMNRHGLRISHTNQAVECLNMGSVRAVCDILVPFSLIPVSGSCVIPHLKRTWKLISVPTWFCKISPVCKNNPLD